MRRCLSIVAALSLFALQAQSLAFHVHAAPDTHRDDDHQHGPAIHHHDDFDSARHLDEAETPVGGSVIAMAVPSATSSAAVALHAEIAEALPIIALRVLGETRAVDVRSHGPPPARNTFLRGPPTSLHS